PGMDGFETTRRLREIEKQNGAAPVPIIALTANSLRGDRDECLSAGMDDYISKPYAPETIQATLEKWLPHKKIVEKTAADATVDEEDASVSVTPETVADAQFMAAAEIAHSSAESDSDAPAAAARS